MRLRANAAPGPAHSLNFSSGSRSAFPDQRFGSRLVHSRSSRSEGSLLPDSARSLARKPLESLLSRWGYRATRRVGFPPFRTSLSSQARPSWIWADFVLGNCIARFSGMNLTMAWRSVKRLDLPAQIGISSLTPARMFRHGPFAPSYPQNVRPRLLPRPEEDGSSGLRCLDIRQKPPRHVAVVFVRH